MRNKFFYNRVLHYAHLRPLMLLAGAAALPLLILFGCDDSTGPGGSTVEFPDVNVSYSQHVQTLFNQTCAVSMCHADQSMAGNLSLTSYFNATARPGIIISNDPQNSLLIQRVEGRISPQMPLNRPRLNQNQITGLRKWIEEGAQNN